MGGLGQLMFIFYAYSINLNNIVACIITVGVLALLPTALVLLTSFILWERHVERRGRTPLVSLELFANRQFMSGAGTTAVTFCETNRLQTRREIGQSPCVP